MRINLVAAAAASLLWAAPALAQSSDEAAPPERTASLHQGFYVAAIAGLDAFTVQENDEAGTERDLLYGGVIGYRAQLGRVVIGVEGEIANSGVSIVAEDTVIAGDVATFETGQDLFVGVTLGFGGNTPLLPYVKGGYVSSETRSSYRSSQFQETLDEKSEGFRVAGGVDYVTGPLLIRGEIRYQDLGDFRVFGINSGYARTNTQIVLGAGLRF